MAEELKKLESECKQTIEHFTRDLGKMRTGRASAGILEGIMVDCYGSSMPLNQMGMINTPEARLITIQVYDRGAVDAVEKAIRQSDLGLNPQRDGQLIRLIIPPPSEERRKESIKKLHKMGEENKVAIRNHRRDTIEGLKKLEKEKKLSEDDLHRQMDKVQEVVDKFTKQVDELVAKKEKELMEV